jgi:hypothetical protein
MSALNSIVLEDRSHALAGIYWEAVFRPFASLPMLLNASHFTSILSTAIQKQNVLSIKLSPSLSYTS